MLYSNSNLVATLNSLEKLLYGSVYDPPRPARPHQSAGRIIWKQSTDNGLIWRTAMRNPRRAWRTQDVT